MKNLVAIPCMDTIPTLFARSAFALRITGTCEIAFAVGSLIYDARNQLAEKAVNEGFDRVLWLDSDMTFTPDLMERLASRLDEGLEFVTGLYVTRKNPIRPVLFDHIVPEERLARFYDDYPKDSLFEIKGCGFGAVMQNVSLIREVGDAYGAPFTPIAGIGEDLSFCYRATQLGHKLWCDSSIKLGHVGYVEYTENTYLTLKGES